MDLVGEINRSGLKEAIEAGGIWVLLSVVLITLIVLGTQFLRWRKTWIILEDNLVIIERNTLKRSKNTIAIENISAVNMERNLFERMAGTYRIKLDTSSMTTAGKTDVSMVFRTDIAIAFRKTLIDRINMVKGGKAGGGSRKKDSRIRSLRPVIKIRKFFALPPKIWPDLPSFHVPVESGSGRCRNGVQHMVHNQIWIFHFLFFRRWADS